MRAKILSILLVLVFFAVFAFLYIPKIKHETKVEVKDDFLKIPEYTTEAYKPTYSTNTSDGNSYWFIVVQADDGRYYNTIIKQEHTYFSISEAKASFKDRVFIHNFIQVSKETYEKNQ
jgi:hypothetical protein